MNITYTHERNFGCRFFEVIYKGHRTIFLENEKIRVGILVDRGTDIFEFLYKPKDTDFMWRSYLGIKDAKFFPASGSEDGNILDFYQGGWQELFPNAGTAGMYKGAKFPFHGELYSCPWDYAVLEDNPEEVIIKFFTRTYRTYYLVEKILKIKTGQPILYIEETITNESREEQDFMWGHHPAFGPPFLSEDCIIDLPECSILTDEENISPDTGRLAVGHRSKWPMTLGRNGKEIDLSIVPSIEAGSHDMAYMYELKDGWYGITNRKQKVGFGLRWDKDIFKYLWYWQPFGGFNNYPFYSTTYNIGLEPQSSYPQGIENAIKSKTSLKIGPNEKISTKMQAVAYESENGINNINDDGSIVLKR